jgi:hypothetical protein
MERGKKEINKEWARGALFGQEQRNKGGEGAIHLRVRGLLLAEQEDGKGVCSKESASH